MAHNPDAISTYKANRVGVETSRDGIHDSELTKSVDDIEDHDTGDKEADQQRSRTTSGQSTSRTDEKTSANGTSNGNHVEVTRLHGAVQLVDTGSPVTCTHC